MDVGGALTRAPLLAAAAIGLGFALACGGAGGGMGQSRFEGTRTHDVYGVPLPQKFVDLGLPPPDINVGMVSGNALTTYHGRKKPDAVYDLYGAYLEGNGWIRIEQDAYAWGRTCE